MSDQTSRVLRISGEHATFWCPGCDSAHRIRISGKGAWDYNSNVAAPTFSPSVLVIEPTPFSDDEEVRIRAGEKLSPHPPRSICHSFVTDGRIQFLSDCTHAFAGQTVPLAEWPTPTEPAP